MKCKCGTEVPEGAKFCHSCGQPAPKPEIPAKTEDPFRGFPPALNMAQVAEILGIGLNRAYEHAKTGEIPAAIKIGKRWRVSTKKFFEWLDGNSVQ